MHIVMTLQDMVTPCSWVLVYYRGTVPWKVFACMVCVWPRICRVGRVIPGCGTREEPFAKR